jgi:hypothetical protein
MKLTNLFGIIFFICLNYLISYKCADLKSVESFDNLNKLENLPKLENNKEITVEETKIHKKSNRKYRLKPNQVKEALESDDLEIKSSEKEKELKFQDNSQLSNKQQDTLMYLSSLIFIPLVVLIFLMTVVSIAGFLILLFNSSNASTDVSSMRSQAFAFRNNLNNSEIIELLKYKKYLKKKTKTEKNSNYQQEPEPESIFLKN